MEPVQGGGQYAPDNWVVVKLQQEEGPDVYKLVAGWSGNLTGGDYWQINSGIVRVEDHETYYVFFGASDSEYRVWKDHYRETHAMSGIISQLRDYYSGIEDYELILPEDTDWVNFEWDTNTKH